MPGGPIGPYWQDGSWSDTAWEANSWFVGVAGSATATITVGATGAGIARRPSVLVTGGHVRPFLRPVFVHKVGGAVAAIGIEADGRGLARRAAASIATLAIVTDGRGQKGFIGAAVSSGAIRSQAFGEATHPIAAPVLVRSRRQRYLAAVARQPVVPIAQVAVDERSWREDDDELALLEVA